MVRLARFVALAFSLGSSALPSPTAAAPVDGLSISTLAAADTVSSLAGDRKPMTVGDTSARATLRRRAAGASYYASLVVFGASYNDNAHPRAPQYAGSLRQYLPFSRYGGRYTNGPVAVEYMVEPSTTPALPQRGSGVKLLDYAYGGTVVQNGLAGTGTAWPATRDQVAFFLSDLGSGKAAMGSGRTLFYFNTGINPITQLWKSAVAAGMSPSAISRAQSAVTANTQALASQARSINSDGNVATKINGADFLIVGIPQLDLVPAQQALAPPTSSPTERSQALSLLRSLSDQYNNELEAFVTAFQGEVDGGTALWFDLAALWSSMTDSPGLYGITAGTKPCYTSSNGKVCKNPRQYLYFDALHPVTTVHQLWAQKMNAVVARNSAAGATPTALAQKGSSNATGVASTGPGSGSPPTLQPTQAASAASLPSAPFFVLVLSLAPTLAYLSLC